MERLFSVQELIINDSFINYCHLQNEADISRWENYLLLHPYEKEIVGEARSFVLALDKMLKTTEKQKALDKFMNDLRDRQVVYIPVAENNVWDIAPVISRKRRGLHYGWYAAASVILFLFAAWFMVPSLNTKADVAESADARGKKEIPSSVLVENSVTKTRLGERKVVFLPDGSKVTLNVGSVLWVDSGFGKTTRLVKLDGEAFFDVQANTRSPFIVQLNNFKVKVLGTMFNVRSYSRDANSETALVKGKVQIILREDSQKKLFLNPSEKAVLPNNSDLQLPDDKAPAGNNKSSIVVKPLTISNDGNSIIETGWMQNRLEINDETFLELKHKLERWYNVRIDFSDEKVKLYKFTATFKKEDIDQALKAMQLSYPFNYIKTNNEIMIVK